MKLIYYILFILSLACCCKKNASRGIDITVVNEYTNIVIPNIQVYVRDINNKSTPALIDIGETDTNGHIHLKLSEKCNHYLEIGSGGNTEYYAGTYSGNKPTTRTLPKSITIKLQHK